jgi:penicillin-binding protein 1C
MTFIVAGVLSAGCVLASLFLAVPYAYQAYKEADFNTNALGYPKNTVFYDREGRLLRFLPNEQGERCIYVDGKDIPAVLKEAFIAAEDERFYSHKGFDMAAIARAAVDNINAGRIVSGASTISQQLVRMAYPRGRNVHDKLVELFRSVEMERRLSKEEILEKYLNRVPLGNNIVGVELASRIYFGKRCADLTPAECALLASIPKAPTTLNPLGNDRKRLMARRDWVLARMHKTGFLDDAGYKQALSSLPDIKGYQFEFRAPHFVDLIIKRYGERPGPCYTTLDLGIQERLERIVESHRARLDRRSAGQAAAIIIHNPTMEVIALAGSMDYGYSRDGFNNGATAHRSAGSTLKPFLYALALEKGYTASETIQDIARRYRTPGGTYSPRNYDRRQYGPVTMRLALGGSLNLAATRTLDKIGLEPFYDTLTKLNLINDRTKGPDYYGLGLAVGNPEVSLEELAAGYAALANGGTYRKLRYRLDTPPNKKGLKIFEPQTAYIITNILSDPSAKSLTFGSSYALDFPYRVALKTGTSTNYRDCWAIGYTPEYTVGVWVGNFSGDPTNNMSGASAAVPIFYDTMNFLYNGAAPSEFRRPKGVVAVKVCNLTGLRPSKGCPTATEELFIAGTEPDKECTAHSTADRNALPAQYAEWVYDKYLRGSAAGYKIESFPDDLDEIFGLQHDEGETVVRIIGKQKAGKAQQDNSVRQKHYTITPSMPEPADTKYSENTLKITYPLDGDRFVLQGGQPTTIRLSLLSAKPVSHVDWFIDGMQCKKAGPPYSAYWDLRRGRHVISIVDPAGNSDSISILVE